MKSITTGIRMKLMHCSSLSGLPNCGKSIIIGFETLTGDVNKEGLGKPPLCVGKALCEGNRGLSLRNVSLISLLFRTTRSIGGDAPAAVEMANGPVYGCNTPTPL
ncbi:hypothetical protein L1987_37635 [Smallanthus sonchifolius]|nr:hypothetical protein L1987_37635 [Smallanthus sonchifolius]